ncbi:MAG: glycosyltransferase family A protein [Candidatus Pacebacteria bacterium]|nr:glycosyltransferase family A protein [Candidatus Paceibacterota bacterium]
MAKDNDSNKPKISVIMPTYNRARYIADAIKSAQNQILRDWELIVVDDGSTDETGIIVHEMAKNDPRISYFKNERNLGIATTRNRGVSLAKADYVAMLDSDDIWISPDKLAKQLSFFEHNEKLGIVGTNAFFINEDGKPIGKRTRFPSDDIDIRKVELYRNILMQSGLVIRKSAILQAGGYDPQFSIFDDHDLWLKIGKNYEFMILPSLDLTYRIHKGGITMAKRLKTAQEGMKILFKYKRLYPGFLMGLFTCTGRFFTSRLLIFWIRSFLSP